MARGGINKALVMQAYTALIDRGQTPSIDAIRIELGNTGSKSTIHRYLKEIEQDAAIQSNDEALLSQPIKALIARLVSGLREEAHTIVSENQQQCDASIAALNEAIATLEQHNATMQQQLDDKQQAFDQVQMQLQTQTKTIAALESDVGQATQTTLQLQAVLTEKQSLIDSLEEKHRHNREAMEHYRQSVQTQREQDQRKHEQYIQSLQAELRAANQTIAAKQADITQLNHDKHEQHSALQVAQASINALTVKLQGQDETINTQSSDIQLLSQQLSELKLQLNLAQTHSTQLSQQLEGKMKEVDELQPVIVWKQQAQITIAKLEAIVDSKNDMIEQLMKQQAVVLKTESP